MMDSLRTSDLLQGLTDSETDLLAKIARPRSLRAGEYLFMLGDPADHLYIVVQGAVDLCFPIPLGGDTHEVTVESVSVGKTLGWSALVKPYGFTLSPGGISWSFLRVNPGSGTRCSRAYPNWSGSAT